MFYLDWLRMELEHDQKCTSEWTDAFGWDDNNNFKIYIEGDCVYLTMYLVGGIEGCQGGTERIRSGELGGHGSECWKIHFVAMVE